MKVLYVAYRAEDSNRQQLRQFYLKVCRILSFAEIDPAMHFALNYVENGWQFRNTARIIRIMAFQYMAKYGYFYGCGYPPCTWSNYRSRLKS